MALCSEAAFSPEIVNVNKHEETLLYVIECHHIFLASVLGKTDMTESTYQSISLEKTNWNKNRELVNWLKSDSNSLKRLNSILEIFRDVSESQEHVANLIDGTPGE